MSKEAEGVLTIIPAKLGSTRVSRKNIRLLAGKPLMAYAIKTALASGVCGEVMVSTESPQVVDVAQVHGAEVPFMRPEHLGKDPYGVGDVCKHVLAEYSKRGRRFQRLVIMLPTCPFVSLEDVQGCMRMFEEQDVHFLMSVSEFDHNPFAAMRFKEPGSSRLAGCFPDHLGKKRHELPQTYRANGAVCIVDCNAFWEAGTYYGEPLYGYVMPWYRSVDIDTEQDFQFAEFLIQQGAISHD